VLRAMGPNESVKSATNIAVQEIDAILVLGIAQLLFLMSRRLHGWFNSRTADRRPALVIREEVKHNGMLFTLDIRPQEVNTLI
jgi:hypothetical protein